ncbi:MAG: 2-hydroxychromene-2-carboxylate isomerase [Betaproteobacteria bacterium]
MPAPLEFVFDFSSPYSYLLSEKIEAVATRHGRSVAYKPILLGAAFKVTGMAPLVEVPVKGDYSCRDFERSARFHGVAFRMPTPFPVGTVTAARALLWLQGNGSAKSVPFVHKVLRAYFAEGRNIGEPAVVGQIATELGIDGAALLAGAQEPAIKDRLKKQVDEAIARGVFGAPFVFVDQEPFWGHDRLDQIDRWLQYGSF